MKSTRHVAMLGFALTVLSGCGSGALAPTPVQSTPASAPAPLASGQPTSSNAPSTAVPSTVAPSKLVATSEPSRLAPVPQELQFRWIGPLRDVPQIVPKGDFTGLEMSSGTTWFHAYTQGDGPDLRSMTTSPSANELSFVSTSEGAGCHRNDTGTYSYTLDPSKTLLTLAARSDQCLARVAAFSGDWTRSDCPDARGWCLGDLASGDHASAVFTPFTTTANWKYDYGELSYSVPSGWSNAEDVPGAYVLRQQNAGEFTAIYLFEDVLAHQQGADCAELPDTTIGSSAADLTQYLTALPSVATTVPESVTIGGLSGSTVDVSIDPSWTQTCVFSEGKPAAQLFSNDDPRHEFDWGLGGDGHMRAFLLALPNDRTLLIDIESTDEATWAALLPDAMPIVQSFAFSQ